MFTMKLFNHLMDLINHNFQNPLIKLCWSIYNYLLLIHEICINSFKLNFDLYRILKIVILTTATSCNDFVVTTLPHGNLDPVNNQVSLQGKRQLFSPRSIVLQLWSNSMQKGPKHLMYLIWDGLDMKHFSKFGIPYGVTLCAMLLVHMTKNARL